MSVQFRLPLAWGVTRPWSYAWERKIPFLPWIALSTVFTYQNQAVDALGGLVLGLVCLWAVPAFRPGG